LFRDEARLINIAEKSSNNNYEINPLLLINGSMQLADPSKQLPPSDLQGRPLRIADEEMRGRSELQILHDHIL
jgi:hypothetical protein